MPELTRSAQLLVDWYTTHPGGEVPLERPPVRPDPPSKEFILLDHTKYAQLKCFCCKRRGTVSGLWHLTFKDRQSIEFMCAACGLTDAFLRWRGGYMRPTLLSNRLIATVTYK